MDYSTLDTHTQHTWLMFNECLIHLFDCTCLNVMCVCSTLYGSIQKDFDHFICFWKWFLSLFVFIFSAYFVFHCLNMFCVEKQVLEFLATHFSDLQVARPSHEFWLLVLATCKLRDPVTSLHKMDSQLSSRLASRETLRNSFLKSFFMGNLF